MNDTLTFWLKAIGATVLSLALLVGVFEAAGYAVRDSHARAVAAHNANR